MTHDQSCCSSEVQVVCIFGDETIIKCLYNLFLAIKQIRRATLAGFSKNNGVVYAKFHKSIICITVLNELIKGITVLYTPNQVHSCTVWLIQYSYAIELILHELYSTLFHFDPPTQSTIHTNVAANLTSW